jgi:hypothetical protein
MTFSVPIVQVGFTQDLYNRETLAWWSTFHILRLCLVEASKFR